jgi:hypothetical protein
MTPEHAELLARLTALLEEMAYQKRPCRLCGERVYFVQARKGTCYILNADATHHQATCTRSGPPKKPKRQRQDALFGPDPASFLN